jgi:hypothetical protein
MHAASIEIDYEQDKNVKDKGNKKTREMCLSSSKREKTFFLFLSENEVRKISSVCFIEMCFLRDYTALESRNRQVCASCIMTVATHLP